MQLYGFTYLYLILLIFKHIWPIVSILTVTTTPGQSGLKVLEKKQWLDSPELWWPLFYFQIGFCILFPWCSYRQGFEGMKWVWYSIGMQVCLFKEIGGLLASIYWRGSESSSSNRKSLVVDGIKSWGRTFWLLHI